MKKRPENDSVEYSGETFYPSFFFKEIVVMMLIFLFVAVVLAVFFPVELGDPADPTDNTYLPRPEWYFLSLFQLLIYFPGKFEIIATAIIPAGGLIALCLLPFIDRNPEIRPSRRPVVMTLIFITVLTIVVLTLLGLK